MEQLLSGTTAYKIFEGDRAKGCLSHAYMLFFCDTLNLRNVLKSFALKFFDATPDSRVGKLILSESFSDLKIFPYADKKLTVSDAGEIIEDSVLKPVEGDKKLYIISDFDTAAPIFQNKLLKVLEEPPTGVYFLLGATSLAPVLDTIKSRVKMLEIPPFTTDEIYSALCRKGDNKINRQAAESCGGILGVAQNMISDGWFAEVTSAANELCSISTLAAAGEAAIKYSDFKYKNQLLAEMQTVYFNKLKIAANGEKVEGALSKAALVYAIEGINKAIADVKFNANFSAMLYDLLVRIILKNEN